MPLQQLVEYFNDRLEQEQQSGFRPFILEKNEVFGVCGAICTGSRLSAIYNSADYRQEIGQLAQLKVVPNLLPGTQHLAQEQLAAYLSAETAHLDSVVNFDRLSRTVHMLNYLPQSHLDGLLFLEVDPRHILGVKQDHGAYFEEIIVRCGLQTSHVVISMPVNSVYARFYTSLLKGLQNYQRRGYRLALKFDVQTLEKPAVELISRAAPDFVGLSATDLARVAEKPLIEKLQQFQNVVGSINGRSVLLGIEDQQTATLAKKTGFDLVHGDYFAQLAVANKTATNLSAQQNSHLHS